MVHTDNGGLVRASNTHAAALLQRLGEPADLFSAFASAAPGLSERATRVPWGCVVDTTVALPGGSPVHLLLARIGPDDLLFVVHDAPRSGSLATVGDALHEAGNRLMGVHAAMARVSERWERRAWHRLRDVAGLVRSGLPEGRRGAVATYLETLAASLDEAAVRTGSELDGADAELRDTWSRIAALAYRLRDPT